MVERPSYILWGCLPFHPTLTVVGEAIQIIVPLKNYICAYYPPLPFSSSKFISAVAACDLSVLHIMLCFAGGSTDNTQREEEIQWQSSGKF